MNILLLYPKIPETFWSFSYALSFIGKKAAFPPLGPAHRCSPAARGMGKNAWWI